MLKENFPKLEEIEDSDGDMTMNNGEEYDGLADIFKAHPSKKSFVRLSETFICFNTFVSIIPH